ncbi:hypothetical protein [Pelagimonas varians]|nr:hypothetical protein [Pelagimonas varians]PYG26302.1 hypothetical protein C8N36_1258 [Pelagimonas varians]
MMEELYSSYKTRFASYVAQMSNPINLELPSLPGEAGKLIQEVSR